MGAYFKGELTKTLNSGNLEKYLKLVEDYDTEDFAEAIDKIKESQIQLNIVSTEKHGEFC